MEKINFDSIVKSAASQVNEKDVNVAIKEIACQVQERTLSSGGPRLNMIAYEDQQ